MKSIFLTFGVALLVIGSQAQPAAAVVTFDSTTWEGSYEADVLPSADGWSNFNGTPNTTQNVGTITVSGGGAGWQLTAGSPFVGSTAYSLEMRARVLTGDGGNNPDMWLTIGNGAGNVDFSQQFRNVSGGDDIWRSASNSSAAVNVLPPGGITEWHIYRTTVNTDTTTTINVSAYLDGSLTPDATGSPTPYAGVGNSFNFSPNQPGDSFEVDYIRWTTTGEFAPIPEPASMALLVSGVMLMTLRRRRLA